MKTAGCGAGLAESAKHQPKVLFGLELPDAQLAGMDPDGAGAVVPDLEDEFEGVVEAEDRVAPQQLAAAAQLHEHCGVDRFAVERLLAGDPGVGEASAFAVVPIPLHGHEDLVPADGLEADAVTARDDPFERRAVQ